MQLGLDDVSSLIQKDMMTFDDGGELVEDGVTGQVDLVKEDPVTTLQALDQGTFNELKNEASPRLQLLSSLLQVLNHCFEGCHLLLINTVALSF